MVFVFFFLFEDLNMSFEEWFGFGEGKFFELRDVLENVYFKRLRWLEEMFKKVSDILWWFFI